MTANLTDEQRDKLNQALDMIAAVLTEAGQDDDERAGILAFSASWDATKTHLRAMIDGRTLFMRDVVLPETPEHLRAEQIRQRFFFLKKEDKDALERIIAIMERSYPDRQGDEAA